MPTILALIFSFWIHTASSAAIADGWCWDFLSDKLN